jgi:hypothetical protein
MIFFSTAPIIAVRQPHSWKGNIGKTSFLPSLNYNWPTGSRKVRGRQNPEKDPMFGNTYPTAIAVFSLTPLYQLLPVYQR